ncbi:hypothetical protein ASPZODRAFT_74306 [Penicilliopsis zonata CBS 506.65]|uniref:Octanoyltransferase n=1 Tax=Penicilliopsis zonata CBS 506.65 TaxID=1073090 RepID=A0A1L9S8I1_9EURO|nr:hypothetical protein ASPZODRAFT_74306 [Penicilliopsis zonata CBS 506.65]OJJ43457.1 hypothetical protein ASPZODRAFT_74306 [Penicilliopsis zonata CBS 506.65]
MKLAHLHLPNITPFSRVSQIQQQLTSQLLAHKKTSSSISPTPAPDPTIVTFTPNPVYTTGRRDLPPSNTAPQPPGTPLSLPPALEPIRSILRSANTYTYKENEGYEERTAEYHPTLRGGQTTYHGPGQMVAYTILDLRRLGLTPRCHIRALENSVIDLLAAYGVRGFTTDDPGVWVSPRTNTSDGGSTACKITAVGVHLRRNISSFGIGLNVTDEPMWYFRQIVPCGLEGREATSLEAQGVRGVSMQDVATGFVDAFVQRVNALACGEGKRGEKIEGVYRVEEKELSQL